MIKLTKEEFATLERVKFICKKYNIKCFEINNRSIKYHSHDGNVNLINKKCVINYNASFFEKKRKTNSDGKRTLYDEINVEDFRKKRKTNSGKRILYDDEISLEDNVEKENSVESDLIDEISLEDNVEKENSVESDLIDEINVEFVNENNGEVEHINENNHVNVENDGEIEHNNSAEHNVLIENEDINSEQVNEIEVDHMNTLEDNVNNKVDDEIDGEIEHNKSAEHINRNNVLIENEVFYNNEQANEFEVDHMKTVEDNVINEVDDHNKSARHIDKVKNANKLKKDLFTDCFPIFEIFKRETISEKTYEDLFCNYVKSELNTDRRYYMLLYQYYKIGFFLYNIFERFRDINQSCKIPYSEKSLIAAIIKGCGIANLYTTERKYCEKTRKRSVKFYNSALRIFRIYDCFPNPKFQIARTVKKVRVNHFIEIGDNDILEEFIKQIKEEIESRKSSSYKFYYIQNQINNLNDEKSSLLKLITGDLIIDIKNYMMYPDSPLKVINNVDSLGLVRKKSFIDLYETGKISYVSNFLKIEAKRKK